MVRGQMIGSPMIAHPLADGIDHHLFSRILLSKSVLTQEYRLLLTRNVSAHYDQSSDIDLLINPVNLTPKINESITTKLSIRSTFAKYFIEYRVPEIINNITRTTNIAE